MNNHTKEKFVRNKVWTMKNGETIPIRAMDDSHLKNTIKMLEEQIRELKYLNVMNEEIIREKTYTISLMENELKRRYSEEEDSKKKERFDSLIIDDE